MKISVITATLNSKAYLRQTIQSITEQIYSDIEYIIIDGGSIDGTLSIIEEFREHIDYWVSELDNGVYDAFNKGLRQATGDIIFFLNADDYLYDSNVLEDVASYFQANTHIQMMYGRVLVRDEQSGLERVNGSRLNFEDFFRGQVIWHQACFVRRELIQSRLFDLEYQIASDYDFIVQQFSQISDKIGYIDRIISVFREGGLSSNVLMRQKCWHEINSILLKRFVRPLNQEVIDRQWSSLAYCQKWLELWLDNGSGIGTLLKKKGFSKVAIFGTTKIAYYLYQDFLTADLDIVVFLDNDINKQNQKFHDMDIVAPEKLKKITDKIDAIVLSIENPHHEDQVKDQIQHILSEDKPQVISWKDILEKRNIW